MIPKTMMHYADSIWHGLHRISDADGSGITDDERDALMQKLKELDDLVYSHVPGYAK